jgi:hypothetical protein
MSLHRLVESYQRSTIKEKESMNGIDEERAKGREKS